MDTIYAMLEELRPEFDFKSSSDFFEDGLLDSFDVVSLVSEIESKFDILVDALDIVPENFNTVDNIIKVIQKNGGNV